jgi:hypothetical protein
MKMWIVIILNLFVVASFADGVGGTSGGSIKAQSITAKVCNPGSSGSECTVLRIFSKPKTIYSPGHCYIEGSETPILPCPENYGTEKFLEHILKIYVNRGYETTIVIDDRVFEEFGY